ncbi:MAG: hypothetical protein GY910_15610 [bacterium]|nr:hypothetical protein [bacterium]
MSNASSRLGKILRIASLLGVALAVSYLGYGVHRAVDTAAPLAAELDALAGQVEATRDALAPLVDATPVALENLAAIQERVPDLLRELESYRALVPEALDEVAAIRNQVPVVLESVAEMQERIDALRSDLPRVLKLSEEAIETVRATDIAIRKGVDLVPEVLAESQALREAIPPSLDRLDGLVDGASKMSKQAGRGVWRGFVRGVLSTPIDLLRDAEEVLLRRVVYDGDATPDDFQYINEVAAKLLKEEGETERSWVNPNTGNGGRVKVLASFERDGLNCRRLDVTLRPKDGEPEDFGKDVCREGRGEWEVVETRP